MFFILFNSVFGNRKPPRISNANLQSLDIKALIVYASRNPNQNEKVNRIMAKRFQIAKKRIVISSTNKLRQSDYTIDDTHFIIMDLDLAIQFVRGKY